MLNIIYYIKTKILIKNNLKHAQKSAQKVEKNCPKSRGQKKTSPLNFIKLIINKKYKNIKIQ